VLITFISIVFALIYDKLNYNMTRTELSILLIIFFVVIVWCIIRNMSKKESDPYELINPLLVFYLLYSLMLPLNYLIRTKYSTHYIDIPGIADPPMMQYMIVCTIGLLGLIIGYFLPVGKAFAGKIPVFNISKRDLKIAAIILAIFGTLSFATHIAGYGGIKNFIKVGYSEERYVIQREMLAFGRGQEIIGFACLILLFAYLKEKVWKNKIIILLIALLVAYVLLSLLIGQRRYIIYLFTVGFIIYHYGISKVKLKWAIIGAIVAFSFFNIYAHTRGVWAQIGITQGIAKTFEIAVQNPLYFMPFVGGEFLPPSKVLLEILSDQSVQLRYGLSYIIAVIRLIPRTAKIWPGALQTLTEWRMMTYYPGLYDRGIGYNFFTVAEGYINFGYIGAFLHMAFLGFVAQTIYSYFKQNRTNILVIIIYSVCFCMILFEGVHAEFRQIIYYATYTYLGPLFLIIMVLKFTNRLFKKNHEKT